MDTDSLGTAAYTYDAFSRRVAVTRGGGTTITLYDGWNAVTDYSPTTVPALQTAYTWGPDLSGTLRDAGGVGGLLVVKQFLTAAGTCYPTYDGNGNISEYLDSSGAVVAHFDYGPFGEHVGSGPYFTLFKYRFSTKPFDYETGYYYYGYRFYDSIAGRWINRDPAGEVAGLNVYNSVENDLINDIDLLGLKKVKKDICIITVLIGHSGSTTPDTIQKALDDPDRGKIKNSDRISCVTCSRFDTNQSMPAKQRVPDSSNSRRNNYIFPTDEETMKKHRDYQEKRKDETVRSALKKEMENANKEAKNMCDCCKVINIHIVGIDTDGRKWARSNLFHNYAGDMPVSDYNCDSGQLTVHNNNILNE